MRIARRKNFLLSELTAISLRRQGHSVGARVEFLGRPIVTCRGQGHIVIGDRVVLCSQSKRTSLGVARPVILRTLAEGAVLTIGEDSGLSGTTVCASGSITIGKRCLFGADVMVADTDFHPVDGVLKDRRYAELPPFRECDAVVVGDDVFVGARTIILKGSRIGEGSVIGAGSVVSGHIPSGTIAAGVPAVPLRTVKR